MQRSRIVAVGAAGLMVASSALLAAVPANAETVVDHVTFYDSTDFGVEAGGYPADTDWFYGDVALADGATEFTPWGLEVNNGAGSDGQVQILNQNVGEQPVAAVDVIDILGDAEVSSTNGEWTFQLAYFAEEDSGFTTLRPEAEGTIDVDGAWITSQAIDATTDTPAYAAGATDTLGNLLDALYGDAAPTLLAYGFFFDADDSDAVQGIWWRGEVSAFTPVVTRTVTPNPITTEQLTTPGQGLQLTLTGVLPGEDAYIQLDDPEDDRVHESYAEVADDNGVLVASIVLDSALPGSYELTFDDDAYVYGFLELADGLIVLEVTAPAPTLPATGAEPAAGVLAAALLALLSGAALVFGVRRSQRSN